MRLKHIAVVLMVAMVWMGCGDSNGTTGPDGDGTNGDGSNGPQPIATGTWSATTGGGFAFDFTVGAGADEISEIVYRFSGLTCEGTTLSSGSLTSSRTPGWPIADREFEIARSASPAITISGTFADDGTTASGEWQWLTCVGPWTASH
jgi:hypothetical protein